MARPVKASQSALKNVQSLSCPDAQIITGAVSVMFRKRSSLSRSAASALLALADIEIDARHAVRPVE
jgi:hypothetical protein